MAFRIYNSDIQVGIRARLRDNEKLCSTNDLLSLMDLFVCPLFVSLLLTTYFHILVDLYTRHTFSSYHFSSVFAFQRHFLHFPLQIATVAVPTTFSTGDTITWLVFCQSTWQWTQHQHHTTHAPFLLRAKQPQCKPSVGAWRCPLLPATSLTDWPFRFNNGHHLSWWMMQFFSPGLGWGGGKRTLPFRFNNGHHLCPSPSPSMGRLGGFCKVYCWGGFCSLYSLASAYGFLFVSL